MSDERHRHDNTSPPDDETRALIDALGLAPHPEGGFYRETFRAEHTVPGLAHATPRAASTAIYYLLPGGGLSALHRVDADECWHFYDGDPVELHTLDAQGVHTVTVLGRSVRAGERPQFVVRAGVWQACVARGPRFALCGCTVAPGFDFADFAMPSRDELLARFPAQGALVTRLTRG